MLKFQVFVVNHFQENMYVIYDDETRQAAVIDPGAPSQAVADFVINQQLHIDFALCTHAHPDHIAGAHWLCSLYKCPIFIHREELPVYGAYSEWAPMLGFKATDRPPAPEYFDGGKPIQLGKSALQPLWTPGHTPGGTCFYDRAGAQVFTGDCLFCRSIGRTDLPGGNGPQLLQSIRQHLLTLPEATKAYPGHGPKTTIGEEKKENPFIDFRTPGL